jgi:hypothetical protein
MRYEGESRSWNWDKHCSNFHAQICVIDKCATTIKATRMSNEDQISAFPKSIPKDCKNSELLIAKGIMEGDRSWFPTLVGNVIPLLTLSIEAKEHDAPTAKRTTANMFRQTSLNGEGFSHDCREVPSGRRKSGGDH